MSNIQLYRIRKDQIRKNMIQYTRKAFDLVLSIPNPNILDIGCGSGEPVLAMAKLSNGRITAVDTDTVALDRFYEKAKNEGILKRLNILNQSAIDMTFPKESFDIIWCEGAIFIVGFKMGLEVWGKFLRHGGFFVIHDSADEMDYKIKLISESGYNLVTYFEMTEEEWQTGYFGPLEKLCHEFWDVSNNDNELKNEILEDKSEIERCKSEPSVCKSCYYIIRKNQIE